LASAFVPRAKPVAATGKTIAQAARKTLKADPTYRKVARWKVSARKLDDGLAVWDAVEVMGRKNGRAALSAGGAATKDARGWDATLLRSSHE
jgi:hypothetical protein